MEEHLIHNSLSVLLITLIHEASELSTTGGGGRVFHLNLPYMLCSGSPSDFIKMYKIFILALKVPILHTVFDFPKLLNEL